MVLADEAGMLFSDDELEEACSVGSSDDIEEDAEEEAFEIMQLAYGFARKAVQAGVDFQVEEELAFEKLNDQGEPLVNDSPRSTAATETPSCDATTDCTLDDSSSSKSQRTLQWRFRPSVGAWLRPKPKVPFHSHQPSLQVAEPVVTAPAGTTRRESVRTRRRIIGAVVRAPTALKLLDEAESEAPPSMSPMTSPLSPVSPLSPFRVGSAAGGLRRAKRLAANKAPPVPFRMDLDDTASETEISAKVQKRPSSLAKSYRALGVELHPMDEKDQASEAAPLSAMMLDLAPPRAAPVPAGAPPSRGGPTPPPSRGSAVARASSATWSSTMGESPAFKVCWAPPTPPPMFGRSSRGRSSGAVHVMKAKDSVGLLPALSPATTPAKPMEWSSGAVRSQKRWASCVSPML